MSSARHSGVLLCASMLLGGLAVRGGRAEDVLQETKEARDARMKWWREARFGMFIHWGIYAVPAGTYKGKRVGGYGEWIMNRARIPIPEYEEFAKRFKPVKFNARAWVKVAKDAGMKYMVITAKHHDGFSMYDTQVNDYNIIKATPYGEDPMKGLAEACREAGIRLGFYYSIMDWHRPGEGRRYIPEMKAQLRELVAKYDPALLWFDGEWVGWWKQSDGRELARFLRELKPDLIINNRVGKRGPEDGDFGTPEQTIPAAGLDYDWETCMTMNDTWGYVSYDNRWKSTTVLVRRLIDIAGKGGNFLLNVGPTAEGIIPSESVDRLREMGAWLKVNGEAVYATAAGPFKRLPWGRCTVGRGRLYLHVFKWHGGPLEIPGLENTVKKAYLLADPRRAALAVTRSDGVVSVAVPAEAPDGIAAVVALEIDGQPRVARYRISQSDDGSVLLEAAYAEVHGTVARYEVGGAKDSIGHWTNRKDYVTWDFMLKRSGTFTVEITIACDKGSGGSEYVLAVGDQKLGGKVRETGSWSTFVTEKIGTLDLARAGEYTLSVKPRTKPGLAVMNLKTLLLRPAGGPGK